MNDFNLEGMAIAPGVLETIVSIAVSEVDGIASVGSGSGGIRSALRGKPNTQGVSIEELEDGSILVSVHVTVEYGHVIPDVAKACRNAVADAVSTQVGITVARVDIYVDSIHFEE